MNIYTNNLNLYYTPLRILPKPSIILRAREYLTPFDRLGIDWYLSESSSYSLHIRFNVFIDRAFKYFSRLSIECSEHCSLCRLWALRTIHCFSSWNELLIDKRISKMIIYQDNNKHTSMQMALYICSRICLTFRASEETFPYICLIGLWFC